MEYIATVPAAKVEVWMLLPHDDDYQKIESLHIESLYKYGVATGAEGNKMLHLLKPQTGEPSTVAVSFDAVRREHLQSRLSSGDRLAKDEDAAELARYLKPDRLWNPRPARKSSRESQANSKPPFHEPRGRLPESSTYPVSQNIGGGRIPACRVETHLDTFVRVQHGRPKALSRSVRQPPAAGLLRAWRMEPPCR
jgi:hypothetical protein